MITLPDEAFVSPAKPYDKRSVPSLAFLIEHPGSNVCVLFCFPCLGMLLRGKDLSALKQGS
jgi:hypothetical protein